MPHTYYKTFLTSAIAEKDEGNVFEPHKLQDAYLSILARRMKSFSYGHNKISTIKQKGFDMYGIDTGQIFRAIKLVPEKKARVKMEWETYESFNS